MPLSGGVKDWGMKSYDLLKEGLQDNIQERRERRRLIGHFE